MFDNIENNERIPYLDYLKVIAMFAVIVIHMTTPYADIKIFNMDMLYFFRWDRFAVPIFLMVSGALILNRNYNSSASYFFIKKSSKLVLPYLFWFSLIFIMILGTVYSFNIFDMNIPRELYHLINFTPLWYFWLILGVYLFIPILNDFILKRKLDGAKYILLICIFASVFYQLCLFFNIHTFLDLRFFVGPILYIVLGYYLRFVDIKGSKWKIILICLLLFIISTIIKMKIFGVPNGIIDFKAIPSDFLSSYLDINIFQVIQAGSFFLLFRYLGVCKGIVEKILFNKSTVQIVTSMGKSTWGMYMSQGFFLELIRPNLYNGVNGAVAALNILGISLVLFFITWGITLALHKIPYLNKVSGYF